MIILTIIVFLLTISFLVFIHEGGHFLVAKWARVWVYQFAIGFGPAIARWRGQETEYSLRIFPMGGFVRMAGDEEPAAGGRKAKADEGQGVKAEHDVEVPPDRLFTAKSPLQRMAIIFAGPLMNIIAAIVIIILLVGLVGLPYLAVAGFTENSPAAAAMQPGDVILAINGQEVYTSQQVNRLVQGSPHRPLDILVGRGPERFHVAVTPQWDDGQGRYLIGVSFNGVLLNQIGQLAPSSPLAMQGLQEKDTILSFNDNPVQDWAGFADSLRQALQNHDFKATLEILRDSKRIQQTINLSAGPSDVTSWFKGALPFTIGVYSSTNVVQAIDTHSYLAQQGIEKGDRLVSGNGRPISNYIDVVDLFSRAAQGDGQVILQVERAGSVRSIQFAIQAESTQSPIDLLGMVLQGMQMQTALHQPSNPLQSLAIGTQQTWDVLVTFYLGLRSIVLGKIAAGQALSGPVGIFDILGKSLQQGWDQLFWLIALLSLNLGIINLLPFPALDGSRIGFILYELVRGKPISPQKEGWVHAVGFFVLIGVLLLITYNDILKLLGGQ
jgi:regulator of sigma E protease